MAGAFTAVADDASATWWNPAGLGAWNSSGLAGGSYVNAIVDLVSLRASAPAMGSAGAEVPAWRAGSGGLAFGSPVIGLSYYRLRISEIQPVTSTVAQGLVRQDQGTADVYVRSIVLHQLGATFGQSVGDHLVVGATVRLLYGSLGAASRPGAGASIDQAADLEGAGEVRAGADVGAMAALGRVRVGLTVRNLTAPEFGRGVDAMALQRHARAGVAWLSGQRGGLSALTVSADADLTTQSTVTGDERRVTAGVEMSTLGRRVSVRGGVAASTVGGSRASATGGLSVAVQRGRYVDVAVVGGSDEARRGLGLALRVTF